MPYRTWWTENFVNYVKVPGGANMFELLTADEIDEFFSYMPAEIVASMEPKKPAALGAFFQKLLPGIQQKNPGLVQKIAAIQKLTADEAWKEKQKAGFPGAWNQSEALMDCLYNCRPNQRSHRRCT